MTSSGGLLEVTSHQGPKDEEREVCDLLGASNESTVFIGGVECTALIDTGSMVTTVGEDFYKQHLANDHPLLEVGPGLSVEGAGDNLLSLKGVIEVGLHWPDVQEDLLVPVIVVASTRYNQRVPVIIGTNVLSRLKDLPSIASTLFTQTTVLGCEMDDVMLYSCGAVTLPPRKVTVISARLGAKRSYNVGIPIVVGTLPGGVGIPQTLIEVDSDSRKANLCLVNLTEREVYIPKLQQVAIVQPARAIEVSGLGSRTSTSSSVEEVLKSQPRDVPVNLEDTDLTEDQKQEVLDLLKTYSDVFAFSKSELGTAKGLKHGIKLTDSTPFKDRPRRIPPAYYKEVREHIEEMLASGAIRRSNSPWSSNIVLARKHDGSLRLCLDFRRLNARTVQDAYHIPRIEETLDRLAGSKWFTCLDLQSGYWQVEMEEEDKAKTAFYVGGNLGGNLGNHFECERMPFGLTNAPATFQRLMESQLGDLPFCQVYLDDIVIFSTTFEEHKLRLEQILQRLRACGLKLKPSKCHFLLHEVKYLGHVISKDGIATDPDKIRVIQEWPLPSTVHELRQALGFFGYYRRYVKGYSTIAKPLHDLLTGHENSKHSNKKTPVVLNADAKAAFETLKQMLLEPPILGFADYTKPFELHVDASLVGLGAILYQKQDGHMRVIAYASRGLKPSEARYPTHKLEFLALKWAICDKFHDYLYGHKCEVLTDNNPLSYVLTTAKLDATGHRWLAELSTYDFSIKYRSGRQNTDADFLSRLSEVSEDSVKAICGGILLSHEDTVADILCLSQQLPSVTVADSASQMSIQDWVVLQEEDEVINLVRQAVKNHKKPKRELTNTHSQLKVFLRDWDKFFLEDGVLYRRSRFSTGEERNQLVLPSKMKDTVLQGLHNDLGHMGRDRTVELVRSRFFWPHLANDVRQWIQLCEPCIKRKVVVPDRAALVNITTTQPLELVCMDYLSLEPSKGGIEHILVLTDHFSRFAYAVPTKNQTAKTTANALYTFFLHYGFPKFLHSDQGRNFLSKTIKELCALAGISRTRTTPYHAMGNGMCERFNSTLLNMLGTLQDDQKKDWKAYVPTMVHAYNATRHDSTGFSPFFLMMGRHPRLPIDVAMGIHPETDREQTDYVRNLRKRMQYAFDVATRNATRATSSHKRIYDRRIRGSTVHVGDRVLVRNVGIRGKSKLANRWEDVPYTVVDQPDPNIPVFKVLQDGKRSLTRTLHRNLLLPINFLPLPETDGITGSALDLPTPEKPAGVVVEKEEFDDVDDEFDRESICSSEESTSVSIPVAEGLPQENLSALNPLAEAFQPQQPTNSTSTTPSAAERVEDPQIADVEGEVDLEPEGDGAASDDVVEGEVKLETEDEDRRGDLEEGVDRTGSEGEELRDTADNVEEEVNVSRVDSDVSSPELAIQNRPERKKTKTKFYESEDFRLKQQFGQIFQEMIHKVF